MLRRLGEIFAERDKLERHFRAATRRITLEYEDLIAAGDATARSGGGGGGGGVPQEAGSEREADIAWSALTEFLSLRADLSQAAPSRENVPRQELIIHQDKPSLNSVENCRAVYETILDSCARVNQISGGACDEVQNDDCAYGDASLKPKGKKGRRGCLCRDSRLETTTTGAQPPWQNKTSRQSSRHHRDGRDE